MKKFALLIIICLLITYNTNAQKSVALHSNGTVEIFDGDSALTLAYNESVTGDTLYLSGGNFNAPDTINKGLLISGAGYSIDSAAITQKTFVMSAGNIVLGAGCTNLYIEGIEFQRGIHKPTSEATNITIIRCKIAAGLDFKNATSGTAPTNSVIIQCDIYGNIDLRGFTHSVISNCIIRGAITNSNNNIYKNNVILYGYYNNPPISYCHYNTFNNNIFSTDTGPCYYNNTCQYNSFKNNVLRQESPFLGDYATDVNNYKKTELSTIYVNATANNYHLQEVAQTAFLGEDGTQVGIYGGMAPFKEGAVPVNPHISQKSITISTENPGFLNIWFKVSAQQN